MNAVPGHAPPLQAQVAAALLDPRADVRGALAEGASPQRFDAHRNTVVGGLVRALADGFPSVERLVGPAFFAAMAAEAIRASPPRHPVMLAYGTAFPAFLDAFPPVGALPYLADVARLDALRRRAWHAADVDPLRLADFADGDPGSQGERRLALHPSVGVMGSPFPARSIWVAQNGDPAAIGESPETALVWRDADAVRVESIDASLSELLRAARHRPTLAALLQVEDEAEARERAQAFVAALERGLLVDADALGRVLSIVPDATLFDAFLPPFPTANDRSHAR